MNMQKKIEQYLRAAPKPPAPDGLLDKLQADVFVQDIKTHRSSLHRWFASTGQSVSPWRVAAAAVITIAVLLSLSYGATKLIKRFITISQLSAIKEVDFPYGGALSPDGKHFAGTRSDDQLVVIDTSTGEQRKLAENCYGDVVWSADGSEIAVVSRSGEKRTLLAVSLKTGKTRTLMKDPPGRLEDWSPDGKLILGSRRAKSGESGVSSAVMVNLENKEETVLTEGLGFSRFSPKGDWLSYVTEQANRVVLHLRTIDGASHLKYTDFPGDILRHMWSPDGTHIVFVGRQEGIGGAYADLWGLRVEGNRFVGSHFPVLPEKTGFYNWSQSGQLAYSTGFQLGGIFILPVDPRTGKATGPLRQLVRAGGTPKHCWSPDGKQIAVTLQPSREGGGELSFISANTGEKKGNLSLPDIEYAGRGISWSPDGKLIAFGGWDKEMRAGIFLTTVETGEVKLLVPGGTLNTRNKSDPTWSPDSKTIAYAYKTDVYVVNIEDGKPRRITSPAEQDEHKRSQYMCPVFAPDGRSVAYIAGDRRRILATTIDGQETREIFHLKNKNRRIIIFDWSPDGRFIVYRSGSGEIWCAPTDGAEPFKIADLSNLGEGERVWSCLPKWSPTGDAITFGVNRVKYQYWVMENLLPAE